MNKIKLLLVALVATCVILPAAVQAQGISIQLGDRPYYHHGPRYWQGEYEMVWVPGHMEHHHWVHGRYVRGEHRRHGWNRRDDRRDYRRDERDYRTDDRVYRSDYR
jgi:hypothetical protein